MQHVCCKPATSGCMCSCCFRVAVVAAACLCVPAKWFMSAAASLFQGLCNVTLCWGEAGRVNGSAVLLCRSGICRTGMMLDCVGASRQ
jgi:hypothetical protein